MVNLSLFFKDKVNGKNKEDESDEVVQPECFVAEKENGKYDENGKGDNLLQHLQLDK